jgi:hypothetical protein
MTVLLAVCFVAENALIVKGLFCVRLVGSTLIVVIMTIAQTYLMISSCDKVSG